MRRVVCASLALTLAVGTAFAARTKISPNVEAAIKVFKAVGAGAATTKIFCDMTKVMQQVGDRASSAAEAQIAGYMKQLGPNFEIAWNAAEGLTDASPDGRAYNAALDDLAGKCQ